MKKSKTTILLVIFSALLLISVGFFAFLFSVIKNKNIHTSAMQITLDEKIKQKKQGSNLLKNIKEAIDDNKTIDSYFLNPDSIDHFVSNIESDSNSFGTRTSVQSVEFVKNDNRTINIVLSVEGSFNSIVQVVKMIEYMPYVVNIKTLGLSTNSANNTDTLPKSKKTEAWYPWVATISFDISTF